MKSVFLILVLVVNSSPAFAITSINLSEAIRIADEVELTNEDMMLIRAISCVKYETPCPISKKERAQTYMYVRNQANQIAHSIRHSRKEVEEARTLRDLAIRKYIGLYLGDR